MPASLITSAWRATSEARHSNRVSRCRSE